MLFKELPYKQSFSSIVKPIVSEEKDKQLAVASIKELGHFIPNIDTAKDIDLLPIAFNACVINRVNKNGDVINTDTALAIYKNFINKFIDTEHSRQKVIGVILTASLSEFGTDRPLTETEVIGTNDPFNITLGGVIWKAVNPDLCDLVEDSNDPTSKNYLGVSASWELGFSDYEIVELEPGEKNLSKARTISATEEIEGIKKYLKCFGGSGVKDGKSFYRMPSKDVIPMGVGLTEKPAAEVVGVAVKATLENTNEKTEELNKEVPKASLEENISEKEEKFSQSSEINVNIEREYNMKLTSINDITDENLKQCSASAVTDFISSEIKKASEIFSKEKEERENLHQKLSAQHEELNKSFAEMQNTVLALKKERDEREQMDCFNSRMNEVYSSYDLPEDVAKFVAEDVRSCASDESYTKWKSKAEVLLKPYTKKANCDESAEAEKKPFPPKTEDKKSDKGEDKEEKKEAADKPDEEKKEKEDSKASEVSAEEKKEAIASAVEQILDNAKEEKAGLPNSSSVSAPGLKEKFKTAFAEENFVIKL